MENFRDLFDIQKIALKVSLAILGISYFEFQIIHHCSSKSDKIPQNDFLPKAKIPIDLWI